MGELAAACVVLKPHAELTVTSFTDATRSATANTFAPTSVFSNCGAIAETPRPRRPQSSSLKSRPRPKHTPPRISIRSRYGIHSSRSRQFPVTRRPTGLETQESAAASPTPESSPNPASRPNFASDLRRSTVPQVVFRPPDHPVTLMLKIDRGPLYR